jgi:hypothetical protein
MCNVKKTKMSYSPQLIYFLDRMSGFSTNIFRLEPSGSTSSGPNSITRIVLPSNALLNTRSFKLHFLATTVAGSSTGGRLPADISTLVERVEISAGGVQLSQGTNFYNTLVNAKAALMGSRCDSVTGHSELVRANKFDGSTAIQNTAGLDEIYSGTGTPHCIDKWEGFLGTCEPKILDASILPDLVVSIYWASNTVLASAKQNTTSALFVAEPTSGAAAVYEINNIHASIETIGLADSVYDNMVAGMIQSKGFIEIPFKNFFSFSGTHQNSSRFTVATQSLDRIWMAWRESTFNTLDAPHAVPGYSTAVGLAAGALTPESLSDYGGAYGTGAVEKYITNYQKFTEPGAADALKYQLQLNGAMYPQYAAGMEDMYQITKNSLPGPVKYGLTKEQLRDSYFVQCVRLNMPDSEMSRTISGLDTRSVSLNGYVNTTGTQASSPNLMIFAETTSSLRVGAGRQLEIII